MDIVSYLLGKQTSGGGGTPNLQDKSVTITQNGNINVSADTGYDGLNSVGITTSVQPVLETKSVTITTNTTTTITPTAGKDGLSSVEVITNVAGGGGLNWSAIGYSGEPQTIIDGYNYAKNIYDNWVAETSLASKFKGDYNLLIMPLVNTSSTTNMQQTFNDCKSLISVPLLNISNVTNAKEMFYGCSALPQVPLLETSNVQNFNGMFFGCTSLKTVPLLNTNSANDLRTMFSGCVSLTNESLDNILQMCINVPSTYSRTKTLASLSFASIYYPASRIEALPHYQDFIDAGWTIGY